MNLKKNIISFFVLFCFFKCFSAQEINALDGKNIRIKVSEKDLSRLAIKDGRIEKVWGASANFFVKADKEKGEVFIRPKRKSPFTSSFFIRDEFNNTYTILATKHDIPAQNIYLVPGRRFRSYKRFKNSPFVSRVKSIVKEMVTGDFKTVSVNQKGRDLKLWKEAQVKFSFGVSQGDLDGEVYILTNTSSKEMVLKEEEFSSLIKNVVAVSLSKYKLSPNDSLKVFIVKRLSR